MNPRTLIALLLGLLSLATLTSCKDMTNAKGMANTAIVDFHKKFNEQKYSEIYAAAHADFKGASKEEDFLKLLEAVQRKLGKQVKSTEARWGVNSVNMKTTATITRDTDFEQGKGVESFTYVVSGEACTVLSYSINSQDMMTK